MPSASVACHAALGGYVAWPSEGSHGGFAPRGALQRELLAFVEEQLADVDPALAIGFPCEVEHVACGDGIARIHRFLSHKNGVPHNNLVRSAEPPRPPLRRPAKRSGFAVAVCVPVAWVPNLQ